MEEIILVAPTMEYAEQIMEFREEILVAKDGDAFAGCSNLQECVTAEKWIDEVTAMEKPETCPDGICDRQYLFSGAQGRQPINWSY